MTNSEYKPRLGFDIRVKPPKRKGAAAPPKWADPQARMCEREGCDQKAVISAPESPRNPGKRIWLCAAHAAEHNKRWNFFDGLSAEEAQEAKNAALHGDRPTWSMGKNERARAAAKARGPEDMADAHGLFKEARATPRRQGGQYREGRKLPRLQVKAFETLELKVTAPASEIRKRYAELVRRFHPDSNGGDRSAETQLQEVVKAHQILKKAGLC